MKKEETATTWYYCEKCGKKLIPRQRNGLWVFRFGKDKSISDSYSPVEMMVHGSIKMRCFRRKCRKEHPDHWNILNWMPFQEGQDFKE